ncbi:MAG: methyltransferase domain-containing protein [Polyangiaceae bacterium]
MAFAHDMTERLLVDAGIGPGMRVLDVGCGHGNVSVLLARLVGAQGMVLGVDRDAGALAVAEARVRELGLLQIAFLQRDVGALSADVGTFDAAVGRRVLMYQPDAVAAVRSVATAVRPGGVVVFQEHDPSMGPGRLAPLPLHERVRGWIWQMVEREGASLHMGFDLDGVLRRAGLEVEHVRAEAIVQTPDAPYDLFSIVRAVLPRMVAAGVVGPEEVDIDTLEQRLRDERQGNPGTYLPELVFSAWARKPA